MENYKHVEKTFKILSDPATGPIVGSGLGCPLIENRKFSCSKLSPCHLARFFYEKNTYFARKSTDYTLHFEIPADWNFHGTAHGKGLQRSSKHHILTPQALFQWAKSNCKETEIFFSSKENYAIATEILKGRFDQAATIQHDHVLSVSLPEININCQNVGSLDNGDYKSVV